MQEILNRVLLSMAISILFFSCGNSDTLNVVDFENYINSADSKNVIVKNINGYEISITHIAKEILAYREFKGSNLKGHEEYYRIKDSYGEGLYFILNIKPDGVNRDKDIMMQDVNDYNEYAERFLDLTFGIKQLLKMEFEGGSLLPVLANTEHSYGLTEHRSILVAFIPNSESEKKSIMAGEDVIIAFNDRIFHTGLNRFKFSCERIYNFPELVFKN